MATNLLVGSCFAGIGGIDLGLESTGGFQTVWYSEVDKACNRVLADKWPDAEPLGDIRALTDGLMPPPPVDVLAGGPPCQGISKANSFGRKGLSDPRSALFHEYMRLVSMLGPTWIVMEQVSSLLTSHDDYATVLDAFKERGYEVGIAIVNSLAYVPQTRERIILIGHRELRAAEQALLPLIEDGARNPGKGKPTRRRPPLDPSDGARTFRKSRRAAHSSDSETWVASDYTNTLTVSDVGTSRATVIIIDRTGLPRVMTPDEWELAHGFPAGWTLAAGSDAARWRALGNAVSPPVAERVGVGILQQEWSA